MLKRYEMKNFKSFKEKTVVDLEKTNYRTLSTTNVNGNVLKGVMFVGTNASGKSNSILPVKFLLDCLFGKNNVNFDSYVCLFSNNPTMELKYTFEIECTEIVYSIVYQHIDSLIEEELLQDGKPIFSRKGSVANVSINEEQTYTDVPKGTLFLRDIYFSTKFRGHEILQKWFVYLSNSVYLDLYSERIEQYRDIDLSLKSFLENDGTKEINEFFNKYNFGQTIEYDKKSSGHILSLESPEKMIFFKRTGIDEPIPYMFESLGNRNLLRLLPAFFYCVKEGGMLLLDEFSSGFHNNLEHLLVRYFMNNADKSQLIFVTHSTNLLSNSIMRPDQLYAVDFGEQGSAIKRFSSEKPREAQNLEKMYLGGVFNGIPRYQCTAK